MRLETRVKRHKIGKRHELYPKLLETSREVAKIRNRVNYLVMQSFVKDYNKEASHVVNSRDLVDVTYYYNLPEIQRNTLYSKAKQNTVRSLEKEWKSFIQASKKYDYYMERLDEEDDEEEIKKLNRALNRDFKARPKPPRYPRLYKIELDYQSMKLVSPSELRLTPFLRPHKDYLLKTHNVEGRLLQVRFIPRNDYFMLEIVYEKVVTPLKQLNNRVVSIDIGLDNLLTLTNTIGLNPLIINGKGLKSYNTYYNKNKAHYQSLAKRVNNKNWTKRLTSLTNKRYFYFQDRFHKISTYIKRICVYHGITQVIIGWNQGMKQGSKLKNFTQIPIKRLIDMIKYKLEDEGIEVILVEESYTSITSFLDDELPTFKNRNRDRRVHRGLFISNKGLEINADVNASYQIVKKVHPNFRYNSIYHKLVPRIINVS